MAAPLPAVLPSGSRSSICRCDRQKLGSSPDRRRCRGLHHLSNSRARLRKAFRASPNCSATCCLSNSIELLLYIEVALRSHFEEFIPSCDSFRVRIRNVGWWLLHPKRDGEVANIWDRRHFCHRISIDPSGRSHRSFTVDGPDHLGSFWMKPCGYRASAIASERSFWLRNTERAALDCVSAETHLVMMRARRAGCAAVGRMLTVLGWSAVKIRSAHFATRGRRLRLATCGSNRNLKTRRGSTGPRKPKIAMPGRLEKHWPATRMPLGITASTRRVRSSS